MRRMRVCSWWLAGALLLAALPVKCQTVYCASDDGRKNYCNVDTSRGVALAQQRSDSPCTQGYSWDYDSQGIWVDHGCRADFTVNVWPYPSGMGSDAGQTVYCSSDDGRRNYCQADTGGNVQLLRQRSDSACTQGYSWGFDQRGIWVDHGCRADFMTSYAPRPPGGPGPGPGMEMQTFSCSSDDGGKNYCEMELHGAAVQMVRQRSESPCVQGTTWGYDRRGVWVDRGCRADFAVQPEGRGDRWRERRGRKECLRSVGERRANELVSECMQVSPGNHAPCSAESSCKVITDEIRRGCELLGPDGPGFCDEYR
jgi:Protein of unknown function (DUF3011)